MFPPVAFSARFCAVMEATLVMSPELEEIVVVSPVEPKVPVMAILEPFTCTVAPAVVTCPRLTAPPALMVNDCCDCPESVMVFPNELTVPVAPWISCRLCGALLPV